MAVLHPESVTTTVHTITTQLRHFLQEAQRIKHDARIGLPLSNRDFEENIKALHNELSSGAGLDAIPEEIVDGKSHHAAFETAAREVFYDQLTRTTIDQAEFVNIWNLLDILQFCANAGLSDPSLVLWFIEELLDSQTIHGCRKVFDYLESRREQLISNSPTKSKQLIVLRTCNELLRRLSRAEDTVFCGRVYIFMFQSFPLGDKSAVNLRGEFHVENVTSFDTIVAEKTEPGEEMLVDAEAPAEVIKVDDGSVETPGEGKTEGKPSTPSEKAPEDTTKNADTNGVDNEKFYSIFWSLQEIFSNPPKVFSPAALDKFKEGLELTISKFKSIPKVLQSHGPSQTSDDAKKGTKRKRRGADDEFASTFNPKYLTSRDLFELELSDLTFQRHILVQALILIDFLLSLTPSAKAKLVDLKAQKALQYDFTLSEENVKWATSMRSGIASYLQEGPDGKFYFRMVDNVLSRDKGWVRWKAENCPKIELPAITAQAFVEAMNGAKKACANNRLRPTPMGSMDLSFLSEAENARGLEILRDPKRYTPPTLESLIKDIDTAELDMDFADGAEKDALLETKQNATWRALRIASKSRLKNFDKVEDGKSLNPLIQVPLEVPTVEIRGADEKTIDGNHTDAKDAGEKVSPDENGEREDENTARSGLPKNDVAADEGSKESKEQVPEAQPADGMEVEQSTPTAEAVDGGTNPDLSAVTDESQHKHSQSNVVTDATVAQAAAQVKEGPESVTAAERSEDIEAI